MKRGRGHNGKFATPGPTRPDEDHVSLPAHKTRAQATRVLLPRKTGLATERESKGEGGMLAGTQVSGKYGLMARAVRQAQIGNLSMMRGYCAHGPPWRRGMQVATKYRVMVRSEHWGRSSLCPGNLGNQGCYETDAANIDAGSAALLALCVLMQTLGDDAGPSFL